MGDYTDPTFRSVGGDTEGLSVISRELAKEVSDLSATVKRIPALETRTAVIGAVSLVVVILAIGFGFLAWRSWQAADEAAVRAECQERVNIALISVLDERTASAVLARQRDRESMDRMLAEILDPTASATDRRDAIVEFRQRNAATEQARATTPYPKTRC